MAKAPEGHVCSGSTELVPYGMVPLYNNYTVNAVILRVKFEFRFLRPELFPVFSTMTSKTETACTVIEACTANMKPVDCSRA